MFEKNVTKTNNDGYGDWLKNNNKTYESNKNINEYFENKHNQVVCCNTINDYQESKGTSLIEKEDDTYTSDIFSSTLAYDDVKLVYSETYSR